MTTETILDKAAIEQLFTENDDLYQFAWAIEQAVLQSPEVQAWKRDAESMRGALKKIAAMDSMSYHSLESAKIVAKAALENNP